MKFCNGDTRNIYRIFKAVGIISTAVALISAIIGSCLMVKAICYLDNSRKTMKKLERAADRFLLMQARDEPLSR